MGCNQCEKVYRQNLDHIRILAGKCAELTGKDQIIYKVHGRIWYYAFSETARGQYIETVRFSRNIADSEVLPDNEDAGLVAANMPEPKISKRKRGKVEESMGDYFGAVLSSVEPEEVQGTPEKGDSGGEYA
jgi:hypothetical protein